MVQKGGKMIDYIMTQISGIRVRDIIDILLVAILIYNVIRMLRGTRAEQLSKGIIFLLILTEVSNRLEIYTVNWILTNLMTLGMVAILIVFQPELRRGLEYLGRSSTFHKNLGSPTKQKSEIVGEISAAIASLSRQKIGALIVMEKQTGLNEIAETGTKIDGFVTSGLLINIFIPNTPLHDGAVIIKGDRIVAAACFLPLSDNQGISKELGTRHRAAIGMSERSDSMSIIVSEETGSISIAENGKISRHLDIATLEDILQELYEPTIERSMDWLGKWGGNYDNKKQE